MAWDFETEPEFQEKLDWTREFVDERGRAARPRVRRASAYEPLTDELREGHRPAEGGGARRRASGPATSAPSSAARATAS